jgi:hypothetical protein
MLTRAFLLLLAMMTGLPAAQAADLPCTRQEQAQVGIAIAQLAQNCAARISARAAHVAPGLNQNHAISRKQVVTEQRQILQPLACVFRADRARE